MLFLLAAALVVAGASPQRDGKECVIWQADLLEAAGKVGKREARKAIGFDGSKR